MPGIAKRLRDAPKHLERALRRLAIRGIAAAMGHAAPGRVDWRSRPHRVLFLRHDRIGDMLLSTGVIRAIAESHPTITVDVLASPANAPVLRAEPHVAAVVVLDRHRPWTYPAVARRLRGVRYDAVVDCMVTAPSLTTLLLMLASGARQRIGVARRGNDFLYTLPVEPLPEARHMVEHLAALVGAFDVDPRRADTAPAVTLLAEERRTAEERWRELGDGVRLLVNVSCGKAARLWPDERFVAVVRHVRARRPDVRLLLLHAPDESERAARIATRAGIEVAATPGIRDALALVAGADLVFTPDTSIGHAASVFRKPGVVLFLDGKAPAWGLYGAPGTSLSSPDQELASLGLEPVLQAIDGLLDLPAAAARGAPATPAAGAARAPG